MNKSQPRKVSKISVLRKMIGLDKKKPDKNYVVPNNSLQDLHSPGFYDPSINATDTQLSGNMVTQCAYCQNLAKNFLYLESLIRNNTETTNKCNVCHAALKYLEHVNRNVRQAFGHFEAVVKTDRALAAAPPKLPKYSVTPMVQRSAGGAILAAEKSLKTVKRSKSKTQVLKGAKSSKTLKPLKSLKSLKSIKSGKINKALKSSKSSKSLNKRKSKQMLKSCPKCLTGRGKMVLKQKFRKTAINPPGGLAVSRSKMAASRSKMASSRSKMAASHSQMARSRSQMGRSRSQMARSRSKMTASHSKMPVSRSKMAASRSKMAASRSKMAASRSKIAASRSKMAASHSKLGATKQKKLPKKRSGGVPTSINWQLLKQNMPKRMPLVR